MISPYLVRLLCLSFALFFLVHLALSLCSFAATPSALRLARRLRPRTATWLLLALRLGPLSAAALVVLGLCLPSYLLLEPQASAERMGAACLGAALAGAAAWLISIARGLQALAGALGDMRRCRELGGEWRTAGKSLPVQVIESEAPLLALAGVLRPRIVVSRGIVRALSSEQLEAALSHEQAHWASRDNLKRLLLLVAPDPFLFFGGLGQLERGWAKFAEWAADDCAVAGDWRRSLSLASALVRVARMGRPSRPVPLMATLVAGEADELSVRVERLLRPGEAWERPVSRPRIVAGGAALVATVLVTTLLLLEPVTLDSIHRLLEHLVH